MVYKVIWAILFLLNKEIPAEKLLTKESICKIKPIAEATWYNVVYPTLWQDIEMLHTLIALGYVESRFTYTIPKDQVLVSPKGACGLFQAIPKYTEYICDDFKYPVIAGMVAVEHLKMIHETWGKEDKHLCHYNSGVKCNKKSRKYAKDVIKAKEETQFIFDSSLMSPEIILISLVSSQCPKGKKVNIGEFFKMFNNRKLAQNNK